MGKEIRRRFDQVAARREIQRDQCFLGAWDACRAEGEQGFARVDFFYTRDGTILVNEINTIPGMTAASYFPKMWAASGLPIPQLLDRMIATALRRRPGAH